MQSPGCTWPGDQVTTWPGAGTSSWENISCSHHLVDLRKQGCDKQKGDSTSVSQVQCRHQHHRHEPNWVPCLHQQLHGASELSRQSLHLPDPQPTLSCIPSYLPSFTWEASRASPRFAKRRSWGWRCWWWCDRRSESCSQTRLLATGD